MSLLYICNGLKGSRLVELDPTISVQKMHMLICHAMTLYLILIFFRPSVKTKMQSLTLTTCYSYVMFLESVSLDILFSIFISFCTQSLNNFSHVSYFYNPVIFLQHSVCHLLSSLCFLNYILIFLSAFCCTAVILLGVALDP